MSNDYNQWSSIRQYTGGLDSFTSWIPEEDRQRIAAYIKYDQMYWNDGRQYALRVLENEQPVYIPNARIIVDTTSHFLLKGLVIEADGSADMKKKLEDFLKREVFYSRFNSAKLAGVARGDFVFHMTATPGKDPGKRISLNSVDPSSVFPIWDDDEPGRMVGCNIAIQYYRPDEPNKTFIRKLTYRKETVNGQSRISRQEAIYKIEPKWYGEKAEKVQDIIPFGFLDERITAIPIYWLQNRHWDGEDFGSSELRGLESLAETVSQGATDVSGSLSLEGLGVYATDGGRPVNDSGVETDWEVAPGKVMEVPSGSYFRRVEGVTSITPAMDQLKYLEAKAFEASGISDVARGKIEAAVAKSGIALAIEFMPTLAKIETRDQHGKDILTQLFYDLKTWYAVFERETLDGDIIPSIGDKLPMDRLAKVNELNNMLDRHVISTAYYRQEMVKLGYKFPADNVIELQIAKDIELITPKASEETNSSETDEEDDKDKKDTLPKENQSNNAKRPNESKGTEADNKSKTRDA